MRGEVTGGGSAQARRSDLDNIATGPSLLPIVSIFFATVERKAILRG
jgi:hypothetical protein